MNTYIAENIKAKAIKFVVNMYEYCRQLKISLEFSHAHDRPHKLLKIKLQAQFGQKKRLYLLYIIIIIILMITENLVANE